MWFRVNLQKFIEAVPIIGVDTDVDDVVRVLVGSSAIIPRLYSKEPWRYPKLKEVQIMQFDLGERMDTWGFVASNGMEHLITFSKQRLISGFFYPPTLDQNVGLHEFAHLVDAIGGSINGFHPILTKRQIDTWKEIMFWEMSSITYGKSFIHHRGGVNEQEFFAIVTESYFTRPVALQTRHKKVYDFLESLYKMNMAKRFKDIEPPLF